MNHNECTAIFINQLREKVGVIYGNPETTPGGRALKFYSSVRIDIRKADVIKNGTDIVGNKVRVKIVKNKVAPPFKQATLEIIYGEGISYISELLDLCVEANIIRKAGAWFSYEGEKVGQGREAAKLYIQSNPDFQAELEEKLKAYQNQDNEEA
jgi:recombination protein RecA